VEPVSQWRRDARCILKENNTSALLRIGARVLRAARLLTLSSSSLPSAFCSAYPLIFLLLAAVPGAYMFSSFARLGLLDGEKRDDSDIIRALTNCASSSRHYRGCPGESTSGMATRFSRHLCGASAGRSGR